MNKRIDRMKKIFLTVSNQHGIVPLIKHLKANGYIVYAGDLNPDAIGKFFCDKFIVLPRQDSAKYIESLLEVVSKEEIDILIPAGELECLKIARNKNKFLEINCVPVVSNINTLEVSLEKIDSYNFLSEKTDIPFMKYHLIESIEDIDIGLNKLKGLKLSIKPSIGSGSRGFTILSEDGEDAETFFNKKSSFNTMSIKSLKNMINRSKSIPKLILMEMLEGVHYDSNIICKEGEILFQSVKTRDNAIDGTITRGTIIENNEIFELNKKVVKAMNVTGYIMIQYIGNKLVEVNPRWSTSVNYQNFNEYLMAIELALYGEIKQDFGNYSHYIGTEFYRYFDTLVHNKYE